MIQADIRVTACRAMVAYCDVTGFMSWVKRSSASHRDIVDFIKNMKSIFRTFRMTSEYTVLPIGDGIIALLLAPQKSSVCMKFLEQTLNLQRQMDRLIAKTVYPRPAGFRIRVTAGFLYRIDERQEKCRQAANMAYCPVMKKTDFIGDSLNLGSRLLEVRRELPAIIHESAVELLGGQDQKKLLIKKLLITDRAPRGVDQEDMSGLSTFGSKKR